MEELLLIRVSFRGRLGNQMFQYALMRAFEKNGQKVVADLSFYDALPEQFELTDVFNNIPKEKFILNINKRRIAKCSDDFWFHLYNKMNLKFYEEQDGVYDDRILTVTRGNVVGYWQTEKYFIHIKDEIKKVFSFSFVDGELRIIGEKIRNANSVSLHIRRSDYIGNESLDGICTQLYYDRAVTLMREKLSNPVFYIFSDDIEWCKKNILYDNVTFVDSNIINNYRNWNDMYLMSMCNHNIIANSSFSWWGAYLNDSEDKIVVAPAKWSNGNERSDVCCKDWIRILGD